MTLLLEIEYPGVTVEQYEDVSRLAGVAAGSLPPGLLCHSAVISEAGLRVVDVWESEQALRDFAPRIRAAAEEAGLGDLGMMPMISPLHHCVIAH